MSNRVFPTYEDWPERMCFTVRKSTLRHVWTVSSHNHRTGPCDMIASPWKFRPSRVRKSYYKSSKINNSKDSRFPLIYNRISLLLGTFLIFKEMLTLRSSFSATNEAFLLIFDSNDISWVWTFTRKQPYAMVAPYVGTNSPNVTQDGFRTVKHIR